jgi:hypothetical protein
MNLKSLKSRLHPFEPILLSDNQTGTLRILEKSSRVVCDVTFNPSNNNEQIISEIESVLTKSCDPNSEVESRTKIAIHLTGESIGTDNLSDALLALIEFLGPNTNPQIKIHLDRPIADWAAISSLARSVRERFSRPRSLAFDLAAPFGDMDEADMEQLFQSGVRIRYTAGWINGQAAEKVPEIDMVALRKLSEFGFRVPIEWYVHRDNLSSFGSHSENLLIANYSAGFSLPLISQNPYYRFAPGFPALPDATAYCELLAGNYTKHPHFDDTFYPLNILAMFIKEGGWNYKLNIPIAINFQIDEKGRVGIFRQAPALAEDWMGISEIASTPREELRANLLAFSTRTPRWENVPYCSECRWRYTCGGLDSSINSEVRPEDLDTMCNYRKLFLEHFATVRLPDSVLPIRAAL